MTLTARAVATLKEPGRFHDGNGLYLQIGRTGSKAWTLRYMLQGRAREAGLGPVKLGNHGKGLTLAEARMAADEAHRLIRQGTDPIDHRRANRGARPSMPTFQELTDQFVAAHEPGWRNPKSGRQFKSSLARHAFPIIGSVPVGKIGIEHIEQVLKPIWATTPVMADRVRSQIAQVLDAAIARELRTSANPADWKLIKHVLPRAGKVRRPKHHAALAYAEVPAFMHELLRLKTIGALALEFTILSASRTAEVIGATWPEIDLKTKVWTIPPERMKGHRAHRVPLTDRAIKILTALPREADNPHVFVGGRRGRGLSNMAMLKLAQSMRPDITVHGFRSAFRDWVSERTNFPREVAEAALAHAVGDRTEVAYARSDLFEKRRQLMKKWSAFCGA